MKDRKDIKILVAEDDFLVAREINHSLETAGYQEAKIAANGKMAVEMACSMRPDVVLMDIKMPKMDGLEATRQIQSRCPTSIVMLTAHETEEFVDQASIIGASAYLIKPPNASDIDRAIAIALTRHRDIMKLRCLNEELEAKNKALERALIEIKTLRGILPICSVCKKIRDDEGSWKQIEAYIQRHSDAEFSHGICPECAEELYPELKNNPEDSMGE